MIRIGKGWAPEEEKSIFEILAENLLREKLTQVFALIQKRSNERRSFKNAIKEINQ